MLSASLAVASCLASSEHPPGFESFGRAGVNSAIAGANSCREDGFSRLSKVPFVVGFTHPVRIATDTPEAPTLRSSAQETIRVTGSRIEVPLAAHYYQYSSPPIVHTWVFQIEALTEGDAELIVERGDEDIDAFPFNAREASQWHIDESPAAFKMTASGTDTRVLEAFDESGNELAHNVRPHWTTQSTEIVGFGSGASSADTACAKLVRGGELGQTTVSATSPVGSWSINVTVTTE